MEHSCRQCGTSVEDGTPFCPNCGAPQIRVTIATEEPAAPPLPTGTPEDVQPASQPLPAQLPPAYGSVSVSQPNSMDRRVVVTSALAAGFAAGLGTLVPFVPFITLCMVASGGITVTLYKRRMPYVSVTAGRGFRFGALAGFFGFLLNASTSLLGMLSASNRAALRSAMEERLKEAMAANSEATAQHMLKNLGDLIASPNGLAVIFVFSLCLFGLMFIFLSGIGGAIGATLYGRKVHR